MGEDRKEYLKRKGSNLESNLDKARYQVKKKRNETNTHRRKKIQKKKKSSQGVIERTKDCVGYQELIKSREWDVVGTFRMGEPPPYKPHNQLEHILYFYQKKKF